MCQTQIQLTEQQKKVFFLLHLKQQKSTKIFPDFSATSKKRLALLFLEFSFLFCFSLSLSVFYCDIEVVLSIKWLGGLVQARETREGHSVSAR
jgi:hypothetical protein